jgi:TM2 domain-containing membrane protein YozV
MLWATVFRRIFPGIVLRPVFGSQRAVKRVGQGALLLYFVLTGAAALSAETALPTESALPVGSVRDYASTVIKLAVYGPSDEIFIWWGHAAIMVEDASGASFTYDWGIFDYPGDDFLAAFVQNQVWYRSEKSYTPYDIKLYFDEDRDITVYTLDLDDAGKERVIRYAEENVLPENCWYDYNDFTDNCSTRIRDIIDLGTGGQMRLQAENEKGRFTLRQHVRRFMAFHPWVDWYTGFVSGRMLDREITAWDEMFLPVELGRYIRDFSFTGADGKTRSLVANVELLNQTKNRQPVMNAPIDNTARSFFGGVLVALLFGLAGRYRFRVGRVMSGLVQSAAGLFFGLTGLAILLVPGFTGNEYLAHNNSILFINPVFLAAVPLGIIAALGKPIRVGTGTFSAEKILRVLWTFMFFAALAALLLNALPSLRQDNGSAIAFTLPVALIFAYRKPSVRRQQKTRTAS